MELEEIFWKNGGYIDKKGKAIKPESIGWPVQVKTDAIHFDYLPKDKTIYNLIESRFSELKKENKDFNDVNSYLSTHDHTRNFGGGAVTNDSFYFIVHFFKK
jgi:hypothetical protein